MSELLNTFFLFKQKTAYELRISDWSSDVCSSDLLSAIGLGQGNRNTIHRHSNSKALGIGNEPTFNHDFIPAADVPTPIRQIARASCRERVCQSVEISVVAESLKKKSASTLTPYGMPLYRP